jgi:heptosyltransferase-2
MRNESVERLLVRGPNWIGDAVMCEPAMGSLRTLFPAAEISLLVTPPIAELFQGHPGVDRILLYARRGRHAGLAGKWALATELRRARFQVAILFQNAFEAALLACLAGVPTRHGYATDGRWFLLRDAVPVPARATIRHQVYYYLDLLRPLGSIPPPRPPRLYLEEGDERVAATLASAGVGTSDFVIGVNPGSVYGGAKRWLPDRFAETADRLVDRQRGSTGRPVRVVIVGGRGEEELGRAVAERMRHVPAQLSGRTTVRELMAVIRRCGLFLTNDTGPMHIAAAFGVPLVAVFGPTDARTTAPFGNERAIVREPVECAPCLLRECPIDHRCMTRVTVDRVYGAALAQLARMKEEGGRRKEEGGRMKEEDGKKRSEELDGPTATSILHPSSFTLPPSSLSLPPSSLQGITVFLDRDGTLNRDPGFVRTPDELEVFPGAADAIARLKAAGARAVVLTNQSGLGRGLITPADFEAINAKLQNLLGKAGGWLDAMYFCPHRPEEGCVCRKPQTGMVDRAAAQLGLDPTGYYLVGDQRRDMELARRIGARSVMVLTGPESGEHLTTLRAEGLAPDHVAQDLSEAVDWILENARRRERSAVGSRLAADG